MFGSIKSFIIGDILAVVNSAKFLKRECFKLYSKHPKGKKAIFFVILSFFGVIMTHFSQHYSNSISVTTLTYILLFDIFSLIISAMTIWIEQNPRKENNFFGYQRYEVLSIFTATVVSQISALFVIKEAIERMFIPSAVDGSWLGFVAIGVLILHLIISAFVENPALSRVIETSNSSWLQEHISDISEGLCRLVPSLSGLLLPRINPVNLLGAIAALVVLVVHLLLQQDGGSLSNADNIGALLNSIMIIATMTPMTVLSGRVLLQTCPGHLVPQIDKALRAVATLDGVLEVQRDHFWSVGFREVAGSVHVRVRRDANEQLVLAHVTNQLQPLVHTLSVQVVKDSWARSAASANDCSRAARSNPFVAVGGLPLV